MLQTVHNGIEDESQGSTNFPNWSLILQEEHRLKVFENGVLRKIFASRREEVMGSWRIMHN